MYAPTSSRLTIIAAVLMTGLVAACQPSPPPATSETVPPASTPAASAPTPAVPAPPAPPAPPARPPHPAPAPAAPKPVAQTPGEQYATVVSVTPVRRSVDNPQEVCRDVEVTQRVEPKDDKQIAGAVIGAVAGAVIGNQVGDGHGRDAARVAGAVAGAVAGRKIQENQQNKKTETRIERQCETVNDPRYETYAYDIVYSYAGQNHEARVAEDPGARIKLPIRSIE